MRSTRSVAYKITSLSTALLMSMFSIIGLQSQSANAVAPKTVTFNANGGSGTMTAQTANTPTALTANTFSKAGYTFSNWNTAANGSGTSYADKAIYDFSADITLYAQWNVIPVTHMVTFNSNGGSGSMASQSSSSSANLTLNTFTRVGYSFANWNTAANGSGATYADGASYSFGADLTLYAQWTALPTYVVTFNSNGGTGTMSPQTSYGPTVLTINAFTRTGYSFANWNTSADGSGKSYSDGGNFPFNADTTLYAQWIPLPTHTVSFNANGGAGSMPTQSSSIPASLTLNTFTRVGYTFTHWNTSADGSGTSYADGASYSFSADLTLYAQWTAIPSHTVTFNSNGGSGSMSAQSSNVAAALSANTFTKAGYTFANWNTAANGSGTSYADGASYSFSADLTLYAQWTAIPSHTVTFNSNGGSGSMSAQTSNVNATLSANTYVKAGYTFTNWNTAANGSGTTYADGASYSFGADLTLYAQWTPLPSHTVIFNANNGTGSMAPQLSNVSVALNTNTFTRVGYTFTHWNTSADGRGTDYADGATYSFSDDLMLYAQWTSKPTFIVVFNANGGTGTMLNQIDFGPADLTMNSFTRAGYTFIEWNEASDGSGKKHSDGENFPFNENVTLYAQWTAITSHAVTFDSNGGVGSMAPQVSNVSAALSANTFTRSGYSFADWNTAANGSGTPYADGANYSFTTDLTLYAQWTALPMHTVTFNSNGGSGSMAPQTSNVTTALTANSFTRDGYTFTHWNTAADGSGTDYADGATYEFIADLSLYAQWTSKPTFTVAFDANGGDGTMLNQVDFGPADLNLNTFTRTGYTFLEWNELADGSGKKHSDGENFPFNESVTLYAQWKAIPAHTVAFDSNGGVGSMVDQSSNVSAALSANAFTKDGSTFTHWNTAADGSGIDYADGANYSFTADLNLYAQWSQDPVGDTIIPLNFELDGSTLTVTVTIPAHAKNGSVINLQFTTNGISTAEFPMITVSEVSGIDDFDKPIAIEMPNYLPGANLVYTNGSGQFLPIPLITTSDLATLCSNPKATGYIVNGSTITIYTCHLSSFGYRQEQADLALTATNSNLTAGGTTQLNVSGGSGTVSYIYSTSTSSVCSVSPIGLVTAISSGTCLVKVSNPGSGTYIEKSSSVVTITVTAASSGGGGGGGGGGGASGGGSASSSAANVSQPSVTIASAELIIQLTKTTQLTVSGGAGSGVVTYATTTPTICSVTDSGLVTGLLVGDCIVKAIKAASSNYLEATSPNITIIVSDSEKRAADEAAAKAEAEKLALAKAAADAAAAAKAIADAAAAAEAAKAERDRLVKLIVDSTKVQSAQLALLYLNKITWKKSGKIYAINYNLSIAYAKQVVTLQTGMKSNGQLAYKTTKRLLLNSNGNVTIKQSNAPVKGSYLRVMLGNKVVYTQLVK